LICDFSHDAGFRFLVPVHLTWRIVRFSPVPETNVPAAVLLAHREDCDILEVLDDKRSAELLKAIRAEALVEILVRAGTGHEGIMTDCSDSRRDTGNRTKDRGLVRSEDVGVLSCPAGQTDSTARWSRPHALALTASAHRRARAFDRARPPPARKNNQPT
jgi:hypothetical protein